MQKCERELRGRVIRLQVQRAAETRGRLTMTSETFEDNAHVGTNIGGATQDRSANETLQCLGQSTRRHQSDAPVVQHLGNVGPNGKPSIEALHRLLIALEIQQRNAALDVRFRLSGQSFGCALERPQGFAVSAERDEGRASADQIGRATLALSKQRVVIPQRFRVLAQERMSDGPIVQSLRVTRLDGERERITLHGVLEAPEFLEGIPPIRVERSEMRLQGECSIVAL